MNQRHLVLVFESPLLFFPVVRCVIKHIMRPLVSKRNEPALYCNRFNGKMVVACNMRHQSCHIILRRLSNCTVLHANN